MFKNSETQSFRFPFEINVKQVADYMLTQQILGKGQFGEVILARK